MHFFIEHNRGHHARVATEKIQHLRGEAKTYTVLDPLCQPRLHECMGT